MLWMLRHWFIMPAEGQSMTVCVAAICNNTTVVGAADRLLTAGDVEFEPPLTKIMPVTNSVAVMIAGDASLQTQIMYALKDKIDRELLLPSTEWLKVRKIADWYYQAFQTARNSKAENAILNPLGLDSETFIGKQNQMDSVLVNKLASELVNFSIAEVQAIIAGVDGDGPHIYVVDNRGVEARDTVGFAAIGVGYWHANSQMMFAQHAKWKPMPDTLFLTYAAKKRAEVAPGVGEATDMFMIGPATGSYFQIGEHVLEALKGIYGKTRERAQQSQEQARLEVNKYVEELNAEANSASGEQAAQPAALPEDSGTIDKKPEAPADETQ
jgi:20S proteasome alpha/beta subunit